MVRCLRLSLLHQRRQAVPAKFLSRLASELMVEKMVVMEVMFRLETYLKRKVAHRVLMEFTVAQEAALLHQPLAVCVQAVRHYTAEMAALAALTLAVLERTVLYLVAAVAGLFKAGRQAVVLLVK